jgi:DeoR family fructose operon transcriptional repressor
MLQAERLEKIKEEIDKKRFCTIKEIADELQISAATVRRDLKLLSDQKQLELTRGGAMIRLSGIAHEAPYIIKRRINAEEKVRIGQRAAQLVNEGETIIIDSGSTAVEMGSALVNYKNITVATNDILVASKLAASKEIDLTVIGGGVRKEYYTMLGFLAQMALQHINADKIFLGVDAIDLKKGCMVTNMEEVMIKKQMMASARTAIVICDHSKFENVAFLNLCSLQEVDLIITGRELNKELYEQFKEAGINIELV